MNDEFVLNDALGHATHAIRADVASAGTHPWASRQRDVRPHHHAEHRYTTMELTNFENLCASILSSARLPAEGVRSNPAPLERRSTK
jgi:hypothetical protein